VKALVTGGNGFLGRHVVDALREAGAGVRVLDRVPRTGLSGVEQVTLDLLEDDLAAAFTGIDVLVHLAASTDGPADELIRNTVEGSRRLLEAMARTPTRRIVLASSFSVYDWSKLGDTLDEDAATLDAASAQAYDAYAQAKSRQERLARDFAARHGWTLTVLRPAVLWGRGVWGEFLIGRRIGPLQAVVAPRAPIRLIYAENAADAFVCAAQRERGEEQVFNVIDPPALTTWRYAGIVQRRRGGLRVPVPYRLGLLGVRLVSTLLRDSSRLPSFLRPQMFEALHKPVRCSSARLEQTLGWSPRFRFVEALARAEAPDA
jgi:nucleoside-diphosphate-sugar epimerase